MFRSISNMDPINEEVEPTTVTESAGTNDKKIKKMVSYLTN